MGLPPVVQGITWGLVRFYYKEKGQEVVEGGTLVSLMGNLEGEE